MLKFILTSDWHLGYYFSNFTDEENKILEKAKFDTIEAIFSYANENTIPLILVAGDQFENGITAETRLLRRVFEIIGKYKKIKVIMIAGNHDYLTTSSIYYRVNKTEYPSNLIFVEEEEKIIELNELNVKIFASSIKQMKGSHNPLAWIKKENSNFIKIGLGHGSLALEGNYNPDDFPIEPDFVEKKGLDVLALGHWHSQFIYKNRTIFPGTHEPSEFKKQGSPLEISIEKNNLPEIKKIHLNQFKWIEEEINLNDSNYEELLKNNEKNEKTIKKIIINGYLSIKNYQHYLDILNNLSTNYFKLFIENNVRLKPDDSEIFEIIEGGCIKNVVEKLQKKKISPKEELITNLKNFELNFEEIMDNALLKIYDFFLKRRNSDNK